ncbi:uncharacterized protein OCT59_019373 [Rhizophagus irregularis]|uniref:Uncharacterized protein n=1 Tax=Rhizophagus irregularis (strain DAOM 181602 / DAOM 197198 / MUCL 43194) TaxID=747089 RepID=A0A2P4PC80_RHIID|nr:hypothetical protein GLOIN_2v1784676 [Rhizophagus irregularis DAOM 181602=DAOM 197198]POG62991.1 hypothetical protein GLOIN_2v1784676 [Rhizophagus irregularis DAOM 181602=DAOM 197198]UZO27167.1 hypothetical protein OCT59_019373 [Rhizophagus irregularis]GET62354.1 hypothetical protein GLOIN_2v1784676 [Rhizophagus irregularis DAOM 181602=DAOM 197198]|eukprot:XP_025169857.1 hypothetical protein GLOIN_2v1784676 [Rhizophagus irregularis DAOM 181602=DAOM 197198]
MTSNTNNNSDQVNAYELHEELLYELLLYKKKDIIAIQEKLGKTLKDSFGLLFDLVEELKLIQKKIDICGHPILTILHQNMQDLMDVTFGEISLGEIYHLLLYLEWNISLIQDLLDINGYTNQEISEIEADKNAIEYLYISRLGL